MYVLCILPLLTKLNINSIYLLFTSQFPEDVYEKQPKYIEFVSYTRG